MSDLQAILQASRNFSSISLNAVNPKSSLLFGGVATSQGIMQQRLSYVLLHAYVGDMSSVQTGNRFSELTVNKRFQAQRNLVEAFLEAWYPEDIKQAMLGTSVDGTSDNGAWIRYEQAKRKPVRCLERLKAKGYYAGTYMSFIKLMDQMYGADMVVSWSAWLSMACGVVWKHADFVIPDDVWYSAIELVMIEAHRDIYFDPLDDSQWIRYVEESISLLYLFVFFMVTTNFYSLFGFEHAEFVEQFNDLEKRTIDAEFAAMTTDNTVNELRAHIDSLQQQLADKDLAVRKAQKEQFRAEYENKQLRDRIAELEQQLESRDAPCDMSDEQIDVPEDIAAHVAPEIQSDAELLELPDDNILFIGGHPNMLSKLIPMFPKWRFIASESSSGSLPRDAQPKYIFVWSNHLAHSLYERLKQSYSTDMFGYCTATNVELLVKEMRSLYTRYISNSKSGE